MRNPDVVLNNLASKSSNKEYKYDRVYRNFYNIEFFLTAYANIQAKEGNMTPGTDGKTIDSMSVKRIEKIIEGLKNQTYKPNPVKRVYIPKSNGKKRPLGIPSFDDKLVQEVARMILESIYEGSFSTQSHAFRPNKSCHTALVQIKETCNGVKWWVEGDIKGFFDNIDHHILVNLLRKRIGDEKFINLIWKFLRAGYLENWKYNNTFSGTPQGSIISPILSNIYLDEFDNFMMKYKDNFDKGKTRKRNTEYRKYESKIRRIKLKYKDSWNDLSEIEKVSILAEIKQYKTQMLDLPARDPMDSNYRRLQYVRYADDFVVGVIGSKNDAIKIKKDIYTFFNEKLNLELSEEKTLITNSEKRIRFLGYDISVSRDASARKVNNGSIKRTHSLVVQLFVPKEQWIKKLVEKGSLKIKNGHIWIPFHRKYLINNDELEIMSVFNSEIRGMYNYYCLAMNVNILHQYLYVMKYSFLKTLASKYKTSMVKQKDRLRTGKGLAISYDTAKGEKIRYFYDKGFTVKSVPARTHNVDFEPNTIIYSSRNSLIQRLLNETCELCGETGTKTEIHHVKKLKNLKGKKRWEQFMIARNRKTLALCTDCHQKLHAGKLD